MPKFYKPRGSCASVAERIAIKSSFVSPRRQVGNACVYIESRGRSSLRRCLSSLVNLKRWLIAAFDNIRSETRAPPTSKQGYRYYYHFKLLLSLSLPGSNGCLSSRHEILRFHLFVRNILLSNFQHFKVINILEMLDSQLYNVQILRKIIL